MVQGEGSADFWVSDDGVLFFICRSPVAFTTTGTFATATFTFVFVTTGLVDCCNRYGCLSRLGLFNRGLLVGLRVLPLRFPCQSSSKFRTFFLAFLLAFPAAFTSAWDTNHEASLFDFS